MGDVQGEDLGPPTKQACRMEIRAVRVCLVLVLTVLGQQEVEATVVLDGCRLHLLGKRPRSVHCEFALLTTTETQTQSSSVELASRGKG